MNQRKTLDVDLPKEEAESLAARAAMQGVTTGRYLGYHVLRSACGVLHPEVVEFETRDGVGHVGTRDEGEDGSIA